MNAILMRLVTTVAVAACLASSLAQAADRRMDLSKDPNLREFWGYRTGFSPKDLHEALDRGDRARATYLLRMRCLLRREFWPLLKRAVIAGEDTAAAEASARWRKLDLFASIYEELYGEESFARLTTRWRAASPEERVVFAEAAAAEDAARSLYWNREDWASGSKAYLAALDRAQRLWHEAGEPYGEGGIVRLRCKRFEFFPRSRPEDRQGPDLILDCGLEELELFRQAGDRHEQRSAVGRRSRYLPTYEAALEARLELLAQIDPENDLWEAMGKPLAIGRSLWMLGRDEEALESYAEARRRAVEIDDPWREAMAAWYAALVHANAGRWWTADAGYLQALDIYDSVGLEPQYYFYLNYSYTLSALGLHRQDRWLLERALSCECTKDSPAARSVLGIRLASALIELEEWQLAERELKRAIEETRRLQEQAAAPSPSDGDPWTPRSRMSAALLGLMRCYQLAGRPEQAQEALERLLHELGPDTLGSPAARDRVGDAERRRPEVLLDESEAGHTELAVFMEHDASGAPRALPHFSSEQGERYWTLSKAAESFTRADDRATRASLELRCWSLAQSLADARLSLHSAAHLAEIALDAGDTREAARWVEEVDALLEAVEHPGERAAAIFVKARLLEATGSTDAALEGYRRAVETRRRWTSPASASPPQLRFMREEHGRVVALLGRLAAASPKPAPLLDEALQLAQEAQAVQLRALLASGQWNAAGTDGELAARSRELLDRISRVQLELASANGHRQVELQAEREALELEHQRVERRLSMEREHPHEERLVPVGLRDLQARLAGNAALLQYLLGEEQALAFVVTRDAATLLDLGDPEPIRQAARFFLDAASSQAPAAAAEGAAEELFVRLVEPALPRLLGVAHVIIVPDGVLHQVPFEALGSGRPRPAMLDWSVRYLPALALLDRPEASRSLTARASLVVADPAAPGAAARRRGGEAVTRHVEAREAYQRDGHAVGPLENARAEGEHVARLLGQPPPRLLVGAAATEAALKHDDLARYRLLHFATHAIPDDAVPLRSSVLLAPDEGEDGLLQVREILELDLDAELVVLSGCGTGRGKLVQGEGVVGLSRAFLVAGARAVLVSQWSVDDESTRWLMESFYRELARGADAAEALRRARLALRTRDGGRYSHPYYWAPFVLVGDPAAEPVARSAAVSR